MIDIVLILIIMLSFVSCLLAVSIWKKKHYVKAVYIDKWVSIIFYMIAAIFSGVFIIRYCLKLDNISHSWLLWLTILVFDIIFLVEFCISATHCIYLDNGVLIQKNLFLTKRILITNKISIIEKVDKVIIRSNRRAISISVRYLTGDIASLIYSIKAIMGQ